MARQTQTIFLVHGIGAHKLFLTPLSLRLRKLGYQTVNFGYGSWLGSLEKHAAKLKRRIERTISNQPDQSFHIVAHSMGAIVSRLAINDGLTDKIGPSVLLAPPTAGSPIGRRFGPWMKFFCPAANQLSDAPDSFVHRIPVPDSVSFGVLSAKHDWIVPSRNTGMREQKDFATLNTWHSGLIFSKTTVELIDSFLQTGQFNAAESSV